MDRSYSKREAERAHLLVVLLFDLAGHNIHDTTEEGESLLSLACSAGYYELAEVLLRMRAGIEDRGIKGELLYQVEKDRGGSRCELSSK